MNDSKTLFSRPGWEIVLQALFFAVVFVLLSFDRQNPTFYFHQFVFFLNYVVAVIFLTYVLFPRYLFTKKFVKFAIWFVFVILAVVLVEELVLEMLFFPDTRGAHILIFYSIIDVFPTIIILASFKLWWDIIKKQKEVDELKVSAQRNELNFLKSQINPHFLFNNLNNLYAYALENSPKTPLIIVELSSVLRYMLYECNDEYVPLQNELRQLNNFIKLNDLQIEDRGVVEYDSPESIDSNLKIAPLLLMVFVENAFKHSTGSLTEGIQIKISVEVERNQLTFRCKNSYTAESNNESLPQGIGLQNVKKRLELSYPNAHTLEISDKSGVYEVRLTVLL